MTKEPIMIDGVDVSKCESIGTDGWCSFWEENCAKNPDCIHKKYLRKEQECEELKKQYNCYACDTCKGKEDYINLKRHCENAIKSLHNKYAEFDQLKADNDELKQAYQRLNNMYNDNCNFTGKLEQTLTEIKEIAERKIKWCNDNKKDCITCEHACGDYLIRQKISECGMENGKNC